MKSSELARRLDALSGFPTPEPREEQVRTPATAAVALLTEAERRDDLVDRSIVDLGSGTGILAIGAALLGASRVRGIERDPAAVEIARANASRAGVACEFVVGDVETATGECDTVVMNPPFGAQRRHADEPFWNAAFRLARRATYAFALSASRTFIARRSVGAKVRIEESRSVPWTLPATFPHHRKRSVALEVDLWILRRAPDP